MKNIVNKQIFEALFRKIKVGSINFFRAILCIRTTCPNQYLPSKDWPR